MNTNKNHYELSYDLVNAFENALLDGETNRWDEFSVSCPIPGHLNYGIVVWGEVDKDEKKGFSVSLRQDYHKEESKDGKELIGFFADVEESYQSLLDACDKALSFFEQSLKETVEPIYSGGPFHTYTKEIMQPILDALNNGDFALAANLTPLKYRLCGYQEFSSEYLYQQYGYGWAGQFENTMIAPGRYPVFVKNYTFHESKNMYTNKVKDYDGLLVYLAGKCVADSVERKPEEYPFDNVVFSSPYCHAVAHDILDNISSIHLIPPYKAEPVPFTSFDGKPCTTYKIIDESLPKYIKQNPMSLRNKSIYMKKTMDLSEDAKKLYDVFLRDYSYSRGNHDAFVRLDDYEKNNPLCSEAVKELLKSNKIQPALNGVANAYELTVKEKMVLFHSEQMHYLSTEPLKLEKEYEKCLKELRSKKSLDNQIEAVLSERKGFDKVSKNREILLER